MTRSASRTHLFWSLLQVLNRPRLEALLRIFPDLAAASEHVDEALLRGLGCRPETAASVLGRLSALDLDAEERALAESGGRIVGFCDPDYPLLLRDVPDAPPFLYARGDLSVLGRPCIGMVGTRRMSPYGRRVAEEFARTFVGAGAVTVSGLARGIDSVVAETTVAGRGVSVAVLGHGLLVLRSSSKALAERIVGAGGLVLSEFPLRAGPDIFTFPLRNRVIAGLSLATVVLEAPEGSGALITAKLASGYGRETFAVPGQIYDANYAGCHALLASQEAQIASRPSQVLEGIGMLPPAAEPVPYEPGSPEEAAVLAVLTRMPQRVDDLAERSRLPAAAVNAALTALELCDAVEKTGGGEWVRR